MEQSEHGKDSVTAPQAELRSYYFEVLAGPDTGRQIPVWDAVAVVGRAPEAQIVLGDSLVSRRHASVQVGESGVTVVDLGSTNGTLVSGQPVSTVELSEGELFEVGQTVLVLRRGARPVDQMAPAGNMAATQKLQPVALARGAKAIRAVRNAGRRLPAAWLQRTISWAVVLILAIGGMLLAVELIDLYSSSSIPVAVGASAEGGKVEGKQAPKSRRVKTRGVGGEPEAFLAEAPVENDEGDVAQDLYDRAKEHESKGELPKAVELLEQISQQYPEFRPQSGVLVANLLDQHKRTIAVSATIGEARELLEVGSPGLEQLRDTLGKLEAIPATEGEFGGEAVLLADRVRSRIRQISMGVVAPAVDAVGPSGGAGDARGEEKPVTPEEAPAPEAGVIRQVVPWDLAIKKAYQQTDFALAVALAGEVAAYGPEGFRPRAAQLVEAIPRFEKSYKAAVALVHKAGKEGQALKELSVAEQLDASLFSAFSRTISKQKAVVYLREASKALKDKNYQVARDRFELARRLDPASDLLREFRADLEARAEELLSTGRKAQGFAETSLSFRQAALLAGPESRVGQEASRLLKELSSATMNP